MIISIDHIPNPIPEQFNDDDNTDNSPDMRKALVDRREPLLKERRHRRIMRHLANGVKFVITAFLVQENRTRRGAITGRRGSSA